MERKDNYVLSAGTCSRESQILATRTSKEKIE